jgi:hypothetical protein
VNYSNPQKDREVNHHYFVVGSYFPIFLEFTIRYQNPTARPHGQYYRWCFMYVEGSLK